MQPEKSENEFQELKADAISISAEIIDDSELCDVAESSSDNSDFDMFEAL